MAESNNNCSTSTAAGQADQATDPTTVFNHLLQEMKQLNKNFRSLNTPSAADVVADSASEDDGAIEQQHTVRRIREDGETDDMSLDTRVAKLTATQPTSDFLSDIALDLQVKELTGEPINESLASIVLSLLKEKLPDKKVQKKLGQYPRPQNVEDLKNPRVNPSIWSQLTTQTRTHDSKAQKTQSVLVGSIAAMIKAANLALRQQQNKEIVTTLTDGVASVMQSFHDMNIARRLAMKNDLHHDYAAFCSSTTLESPSEYLCGDLSKLTKDIADANKLTKKVRRAPRGQQQNQKPHNGSQRFAPYSYGNRRFPPNQRAHGDFLSKGHIITQSQCIRSTESI